MKINVHDVALEARHSMVEADPIGGKLAEDLNGYGLCNFTIVFSDGTLLKNPHAPCHARLNLYGDLRLKTPEIIVNHVNDISGVGEDAARTFYEWLMNYSPYAECFISKDVSDVVENKASLLTADAPSNLLAGALIITRMLNEIPDRTVLWYDLVKRGVHPSVAAYFAHAYMKYGNQFIINTTWSHSALDGRLFQSTIINFLHKTPMNLGGSYKETKSYDIVQGIWARRVAESPPILALVDRTLTDIDRVTYSGANPFIKAKKEVEKKTSWEYKPAIEAIAPLLKETYTSYLSGE